MGRKRKACKNSVGNLKEREHGISERHGKLILK
jgi:hypothetical protein